MAAICAEGLGFGYSDRVTILEQVRFRLTKGWYGLVGANGSGKTTLARLIQGTLEPSNGKLWLEPASASVVLCDQDINALPDGLRHFANREDRKSCRWRGLMQLDIASLERWSTLSPGERKRWQIAAALSELPDVLIVDEPTNHLDAEARRHVIDALRRHMGVGIAVSHDRELLREVTSQTLRVHRGRVELYPGSYLKARALWQAATQSTIEARAQSIERRDTLQKRVAEAARMKEAASRNRSAKVRMKSRHDHDATSMVAAGRAANGEARISRSLHVIEAKLERASESIPEFIVDKTLGRSLFVGYQPAPQARILGLEGENVQVGGKTILYEVRISIRAPRSGASQRAEWERQINVDCSAAGTCRRDRGALPVVGAGHDERRSSRAQRCRRRFAAPRARSIDANPGGTRHRSGAADGIECAFAGRGAQAQPRLWFGDSRGRADSR